MRTALLTIVTLAVTTACSESGMEPTPVQTEALIASASEWTPADFIADLPFDDATRQTIEAGMNELHASMLDLHDRYQKAETLAGEARTAYAEDLEADVQALHTRHLELWNSLDADVREELAVRFHDRMEGHGDGPMKSLHDRMRRLHGGSGH
jgi:hypothetical protein